MPSIDAVQLVHVATWIEAGTREPVAPSVKQRLATTRQLFDWLVIGQVVLVNFITFATHAGSSTIPIAASGIPRFSSIRLQ